MSTNNSKKNFNWRDLPEAFQALGDGFREGIQRIVPHRGPNIDMYETDSEVIVIVETPGINSNANIHISLRGYTLYIEGEIPWVYPVEDEQILQIERFFGPFKREIKLPTEIAPNTNIDARSKHGLIEIHIPKVTEYAGKDISIRFDDKK